MSGGFRSILAGVLGRFSAVASGPSPIDTSSPTPDDRIFHVLRDRRAFTVESESRQFIVLSDRRTFVVEDA